MMSKNKIKYSDYIMPYLFDGYFVLTYSYSMQKLQTLIYRLHPEQLFYLTAWLLIFIGKHFIIGKNCFL